MRNDGRVTPRERLLARIGDINDFDRPRPMVTLREFFEGNDDPASIGYNLPGEPEPAEFYRLLTAIAAKPAVLDVRIEVKDLEDPDGWPSTDSIWIVTTASLETARTWFPDHLAPDEWYERAAIGVEEPVEPVPVPPGAHALCAWYD
ncbi:hypothetical protein EV186_105149 [Labedaea rhizosphaerae]|uniref:Uncharacterized protein n=1 Tax=Labedaea rhizosphaerae TaxID=598644 RepID=A0A4R6S6U4_LABRH|nr:hypothetical protein EV186_105149 [Labedaea rhizosphaerae]